jgi:hypothetical protein
MGSHGPMWEGLRAAGSAITAAGLALVISLAPFLEPPPSLGVTNEQLLFLEVGLLPFSSFLFTLHFPCILFFEYYIIIFFPFLLFFPSFGSSVLQDCTLALVIFL